MKKVIILWHNGGRLGNQLWLHASVLAYCLENGFRLENYSFFEYAKFFNIKVGSRWVNLFFFKLYSALKPFTKTFGPLGLRIYNRLFRIYYQIYLALKSSFVKKSIIVSRHDDLHDAVTYLPPSQNPHQKFIDFQTNKNRCLYLTGWLFRNPVGIIRQQDKVRSIMYPKAKYAKRADNFVSRIRKNFKNVIGVHVRQGDYLDHASGQLYFSAPETAKILKEFLLQFKLINSETCFIICSDGKMDSGEFIDLNVIISNEADIVDLLILSLSDKIIGSDSTFGTFASYLGNIPFIVMNKAGVSWKDYLNKTTFFEDKKCIMTHY